jgi:hypothetical protein
VIGHTKVAPSRPGVVGSVQALFSGPHFFLLNTTRIRVALYFLFLLVDNREEEVEDFQLVGLESHV